MSQQTVLSVVTPYYERFVERLPDVVALAEADDAVLRSLWAGLGYYARAARLREAARTIVGARRGQFPRTYEEWLALPGCGPYTAAAVASICFGQRAAVVDGNVLRVCARLLAIEDDVHSVGLRSEVQSSLSEAMPAVNPGLYNQAMMELGALVCKPRQPLCPVCPLSAICTVRHQGREVEIPRPKQRRQAVLVDAMALVLSNPSSGKIALWRRTKGLLAGSVGFPLLTETTLSRIDVADHLVIRPVTIKHSITHHRLKIRVAEVEVGCGDAALGGASEYELAMLLAAVVGSRPTDGPMVCDGPPQWIPRKQLLTALSSSLDHKVWHAVN